MFTKQDYETLAGLVFVEGYSGYKPTVSELPNGDGKVDAEKRYAHVATKYMQTIQQRADLSPFLERAHQMAVDAARQLRLLPEYMPRIEYGALRVLEYPADATSAKHTDFDLFTLMLYRDQTDRFVAEELHDPMLVELRQMNGQAHLGEIAQEIGLGVATPHQVLASATPQHSIVYFAIPDWNTVLPRGISVKDWLNERMARSRTEFDKYK